MIKFDKRVIEKKHSTSFQKNCILNCKFGVTTISKMTLSITTIRITTLTITTLSITTFSTEDDSLYKIC